MRIVSRLGRERAFHDRQAQARASWFAARPAALCFADDDYLDHETWVRPALDALGDVAGQPVLDYGCGHGMAAVVLARRGARVTALDASGSYVAEAWSRARANQVKIDLVQADGELLPFADNSFAGVWGHAILHHLHVQRAACEIRRVLRPGGRAVFCEPWGGNLLLRWARENLTYPGKGRTAEERPLEAKDLRTLERVFGRVRVRGFQLFSMARRWLGASGSIKVLTRWDNALVRWAPTLQRWCRYLVIHVEKNEPRARILRKEIIRNSSPLL